MTAPQGTQLSFHTPLSTTLNIGVRVAGQLVVAHWLAAWRLLLHHMLPGVVVIWVHNDAAPPAACTASACCPPVPHPHAHILLQHPGAIALLLALLGAILTILHIITLHRAAVKVRPTRV